MAERISLGKITAEVTFKEIKNVHLSVYPPNGRIRISAPSRMSLDTIRVFALSKLSWIKQQRKKFQEQDREPQREYLNRESHYLWGKRYLLRVIHADAAPSIEVRHSRLVLQIRPGTPDGRIEEIFAQWYRDQLKVAVPEIVAKWTPILKVTVKAFYVQHMKTKWGSCNHPAGTIRLNTELAKKPKECLEYVVVHEMVHLLVPNHGTGFIDFMAQVLPNWRLRREQLNQLPVRHEEWYL
jgi:predicted metal-dependent hydrolase